MTRRFALAASTALGTLVSAVPAMADLTAPEAWTLLQEVWTDSGYTVDGTETELGDILSISGFTLSAPLENTTGPDGTEGVMVITADAIALEELGDGAVRIAFPEEMSMVVDLQGPEVGDVSVNMALSHVGLDMAISGTADDATFDYSADTIGIALVEVVIDDDPLSEAELAFEAALNAMAGQSRLIVSDDGMQVLDEMGAASATVTLNLEVEDTKDRIGLNLGMADIAISNDSRIPPGATRGTLPEMIDGGVVSSSSVRTGVTNMVMTVTNDSGVTTVNGGAQSSLTVAGVEEGAVKLAGGAMDVTLEVQSPGLFFPVSLQMDRLSNSMTLPLAVSDDAQAFGFGIGLEGFSVPDMMWDMIDPGRALSREPATLIAQMSGMARILVDFSDPEAMEEMAMDNMLPAEPESLSLDAFQLTIAGAELRASGDFTFDVTEQPDLGDIPRPAGVVDVEVDGAQALITSLVQMGLLPEDMALGARMALTVFAVPTDGPDNLTSRIEITDEGGILANGMRVR